MKSVMLIIPIAAAGLAAYWLTASGPEPTSGNTEVVGSLALVDIQLPDTLSGNVQIGRRAFEANCTARHGVNAAGRDGVAPPLVHAIYEPSHHGDESFQRAVAMGVRGHHWPFENMPPVEGLTRADVAMIVTYIRELQRANDISKNTVTEIVKRHRKNAL